MDTIENTLENNKIIAGFMNKPLFRYEGLTKIENKPLYHSDWNWLMEVVDKIYEMDLYYDKYIDYNSSMFSSGKIELSANISKVYEQVIEFIKWYNEQNK